MVDSESPTADAMVGQHDMSTEAAGKQDRMAALGLAEGWPERLRDEFDMQYMSELRAFLAGRKQNKKVIYPHSSNWFKAFKTTAFEDVKVVILGQDPYHGPGQAHGLSFSVPEGIAIPPSLLNMYKELGTDVGLERPTSGNLEQWSAQGVFLLNSVLTVEAGKAGSHQGRGWEEFTDKVVELLSTEGENRVFLLWGSYAQKKGQIIDSSRHLVLKCPHPSPLSAHRGFLGCRHFSQTNAYLESKGYEPVDWSVSKG